MAVSSFRQQCPSCEERVLIKDVGMVGKKVDCPKCKYRFVVAKPAGADEKTKPAKAKAGNKPAVAKAKGKTKPDRDDDFDSEEDEPRKKKKKKDAGGTKLVVWLAVAGVALILLAVAGFFLLNEGDGNDKKLALPTRPQGGDPYKGKDKGKGPVTPGNPGDKVEVEDPTNLLLPGTEMVLNIPVQDLLRSPLGLTIFEGSLTPRNVETNLGINLSSLERLLVSGNFSERWQLIIMRTSKDVDFEAVKKALALKPADAKVNDLEYFITTLKWREFLGRTSSSPEPLAVRLQDKKTLVLGDPEPVKKFLEAKGKPAAQPDGVTPPGGQAAQSYATLKPEMRDLLAHLEKRKPLLLSTAVHLEAKGELLTQMKQMAGALPELQMAFGQRFVGGALHVQGGWMGATVAAECMDRESSNAMLKLFLASVVGLEDFFKPMKVAVEWNLRQPQVPMPPGPGGNQPGFPPRQPGFQPGQPPPGFQPEGGVEGQPGIGRQEPVEKPLGQAKIEGPRQDARTVQLTVMVDLPAFHILQRSLWMPYILRSRGDADLALKNPTPHDLGNAVKEYGKKMKQFPRGAYPRKKSTGRFARPWHPDERVSGFADLLPFLGYDTVHAQIDFEKSWRDGENLLAAMTLIPYFVDPAKPSSMRYVQQPGLRGEVAATHYVGIAGVGLDAADYPADAAHADKLGIWGYDRQTAVADLGSNLASTIFLIEIPPAYRGPWLAGGGATVRGVPETNSVQPFVSRTYNGKPGTFAIMADGVVRFIPADIPDEVFKALCTIKKPAGFKFEGIEAVPPSKPMTVEKTADTR